VHWDKKMCTSGSSDISEKIASIPSLWQGSDIESTQAEFKLAPFRRPMFSEAGSSQSGPSLPSVKGLIKEIDKRKLDSPEKPAP
jgi:hypothetical protein